MGHPREGQTAVIFVSESTGSDPAGYTAAADQLGELVARQPGFRGVDWIANADGGEITISYWADDASAAAWREHPEHARIQHEGRGKWLRRYDLMVAEIRRGHLWER
ncbi:antibiotic biosynthesis monooxygenase [Sphingomonas sp.]|uniref:antibiotic biosynthesis monooxygenase n=1 Tax=Sphingomonas sp. TaxID=28214 RepID=UPI001ECC06FB|nr:antibiotic biosynthesis monooxygenase [Sphingomonas sp.]MBX3593652.1 antibiotic biosynthesis monooxygenase [Sphingomonas sp.]